MSEYLPLYAALLGAAVGGTIGFASAYLIQRQRFKREDEAKLFEKVYGRIYPLLRKARMRYEHEDFQQWPGEFLLLTPEVVQIDGLLAKYSHLIPSSIQRLWIEAKDKGPDIKGLGETEADNVFFPFDLQKMLDVIQNELKKRAK